MTACFYCDEAVLATDLSETVGGRTVHVECAARAVIGSLAHLMRRCTCYGGTASDADEPTISRREAAKRAYDYMRTTTSVLTVYVVYAQPTDYPESYVLRGQDVLRGGEIRPHPQPLAVAPTLEEVRARVPRGCTLLAPDARDPPQIVETWI